MRAPLRTRISASAALAAGVALLASGCGGESDSDPAGAPTASPQASPAPTASPTPGAQVRVRGLEVPWGLAFDSGGDAWVTERISGRVLRISPTGDVTEEADLSAEIAAAGEGGLLGIAIDPSPSGQDAVYVYLTTATDNRVARLDGDTLTPILTGIPQGRIHNGGRLAFGPDGLLYATTGDAGSVDTAQDPASLGGKILRIRADGSVPPDNPFPGSPVYSLGHRNVQGLAWDAGGRLWATEFGSSAFDEVNLIQAGRNYGWPLAEGFAPPDAAGLTDPEVIWQTSEASPSGAAILDETLYVAALRGRRVWSVPLSQGVAGPPQALLQGAYGRVRTLEVAPDGSLWLMTSNRDGRGEPVASDDRIVVLRPDAQGRIPQ